MDFKDLFNLRGCVTSFVCSLPVSLSGVFIFPELTRTGVVLSSHKSDWGGGFVRSVTCCSPVSFWCSCFRETLLLSTKHQSWWKWSFQIGCISLCANHDMQTLLSLETSKPHDPKRPTAQETSFVCTDCAADSSGKSSACNTHTHTHTHFTKTERDKQSCSLWCEKYSYGVGLSSMCRHYWTKFRCGKVRPKTLLSNSSQELVIANCLCEIICGADSMSSVHPSLVSAWNTKAASFGGSDEINDCCQCEMKPKCQARLRIVTLSTLRCPGNYLVICHQSGNVMLLFAARNENCLCRTRQFCSKLTDKFKPRTAKKNLSPQTL